MFFYSRLRNRLSNRSTVYRDASASTTGFRPRLESLDERIVLSFAAPMSYAVSQPTALVAADVNGDGKPDLLTLTGSGISTVSVQLNNGNGTFGTARTFVDPAHTASAIAVGDVNGDGKPDIVFANTSTANPSTGGALIGSVTVRLGDGQGNFPTANAAQYLFTVPVTSIALAHVYGSSEMDLVAVPASGGKVYVARATSSGTFSTPQSNVVPTNLVSSGSCKVTAVNSSGNGKAVIVVTEPRLNSVSVLLNTGIGSLGAAQTYAVGATPVAVALGTVSGSLDIVTANTNGTVSLLAELGNGTFGAVEKYAIGGPANSVALGDLDHDGTLDIVTGGTELDVLRNTGSGAFAAYQKVGPAGGSVVAGDFNGDGYADLAEVASPNSIGVLLNNADWPKI